MLEKHPIPQNIMQVEFKLFGSLTVKQFFSLAGGILVAVLIYFLKLPIILGWPLILLSLIIGFALTFVTVGGQPFSRWFGNFLVAIFSSQKYVWRKTVVTPTSLKSSSTGVKPIKGAKPKKELGMTPVMEIVQHKNIELDESEKKDLARLDKYFETEFKKYKPKSEIKEKAVYEQPARVDSATENIAGKVNPIGRGQTIIDVDDKNKVVYTNVQNRQQRPVSMDKEEKLIKERIKEILEKQRNLSPFLRTSQVEKKEAELKSEMRELYKQIQSLKK